MRRKNKICGIYKIINTINNKIYIGSSLSIMDRFDTHRTELRRNVHCNLHLQNSWNKYGKDNFKFEIFFLCNTQDLEITETYFIDKFNTTDINYGYNIKKFGKHTCGVNHPSFGKKHSEETKIKIGLKSKTRKYEPRSKESRLQSSLSKIGKLNGMYGKKLSKEQILKKSISCMKPIIQLDINDNFIKEWNSVKEASNYYKLSSSISGVLKGRCKTAGGFKWIRKIKQ